MRKYQAKKEIKNEVKLYESYTIPDLFFLQEINQMKLIPILKELLESKQTDFK